MKIRKTIIAGATAAAAVGCLSLGGGEASAAGAPEMHIVLTATTQTLTWNPNGNTGCTRHWSGDNSSIPVTAPGSGSIAFPDKTQHWWLTCAGNVRSNTAYYYGPRGSLNDMRTQFSDSTAGMFGS
ncbi:MAG: hypothetical protein QM658_13310 [Gordonia sp. (in: high G+C Gram-positive bacteria)]